MQPPIENSNFPDLTNKVFLSPTDTILGLGALANSENAVGRIAQIKQRPQEKPFILLVEDFVRLRKMVEVTPLHEHLILNAERPTTIVFDKIKNIPQHLVAQDGTVGIRMVGVSFLSGLIRFYDQPIVSTSANVSGEPSATRFSEIKQEVLDQLDYIFLESYDFVPIYPASIVLKVEDEVVKILRA